MGQNYQSSAAELFPNGSNAGAATYALPGFAPRVAGADVELRPDSVAVATVRRRERISTRSLIVADATAAVLAIAAAIDLGTGYSLRLGALLVVPLIVLVAKIQGLYDHDELVIRKTTLDEMPRLFNLATLVTLLFWLSRHFIVLGAPSTGTLLRMWIMLLTLTTLARIAARAFATRAAPRERCFFVGDIATAERLRTKLAHSKGTDLVGAVTDPAEDLSGSTLGALIDEFEIHRLVVASAGGVAEGRTNDLVRAAKEIGVRVTICPGVLAVVGSSMVRDDVWGMPLLGVPRYGLSRSSMLLKRSFDLVGTAVGLLVVSPLLLACALLIKLDSRGPVFFRQLRVGRDGKQFEILKLRTMVADAEQRKAELRSGNEAEGLFKIADDPRITRIGRLLRKTSLDELPQLINVLKGQMSLVGPRPLVLDEDELIKGYDRRRLIITPGMTGPWQILGSARIPLREMTKLDYLYVANWSLWADVKLLVHTITVVATQRGL